MIMDIFDRFAEKHRKLLKELIDGGWEPQIDDDHFTEYDLRQIGYGKIKSRGSWGSYGDLEPVVWGVYTGPKPVYDKYQDKLLNAGDRIGERYDD